MKNLKPFSTCRTKYQLLTTLPFLETPPFLNNVDGTMTKLKPANTKPTQKIIYRNSMAGSIARLFATPKKRGRPRTRKASACAPKVPYNTCMSNQSKCTWVHGKREYCRSRKNKRS